ncbi:hypothetical protein PoB_002684200 [Plakobranchus ocellatus]|uniref:Uncharacterized protein n=1 Tax=Plakobranchus ocellatus TaxID=259542 RepID=A0AAV3ZZ70_9GAST|nr:hypothetical protein PoB_002684200 [Plakobranchus ocellatus]
MPKPCPRPPKQEDGEMKHFTSKDKIRSFSEFSPGKELNARYENLLFLRSSETFVCLCMIPELLECTLTIVVESKKTPSTPLVIIAFNNKILVPLGSLLKPNSVLDSYSEFHEEVYASINYVLPVHDVLRNVQAFQATRCSTQKGHPCRLCKTCLLNHAGFNFVSFIDCNLTG